MLKIVTIGELSSLVHDCFKLCSGALGVRLGKANSGWEEKGDGVRWG